MDIFKVILYVVAALTSLACTFFLFRGYLRRRVRLLLWSGLCFVGLTVNNILVFLDLAVFPGADLRPVRLAAALCGTLLMIYGFVWESE